ncbi:hypothetical protein D3H65_16360 [Paraflavitalea soli]|uniref:DUF3108 domain-containing protein n=1 Tax=Paraflavitalea soli TaxID=2315862 RepID=A0A3B7MR61_9BACT|nr:hypothetical protein [Paraflavitalea soli]AXY75456.1 hypothetical protein D3H65_16360 [Paraflavitalea soli]
MKKTCLLALLTGVLATTTIAQDCKSYYYLQNNKTIEMTMYDKKGDDNGKQIYTVSDVQQSGGALTASLNSEMFNKKGKSLAKGKGTIQCKGGAMMVDMKMSLPAAQQEQFASTDAKADNIYMEYPSSMKEGDQLKDATMNLEINTNGMKQSVIMIVNERKVEGKESVTTTAGTWECYKISYKSKMTIKTMGIGIPVNIEGTEWFAPGFGIVKTQSKHGGTAITAIK